MYNKNVLNKRIGGTKINRFHSIKNNEGMILGPVSNMHGDSEFIRRTNAALKRMDKSKMKGLSKDEFLKELETW